MERKNSEKIISGLEAEKKEIMETAKVNEIKIQTLKAANDKMCRLLADYRMY